MTKKVDIQQMQEIAKEDWPLLKELESTRFSLKNKKKSQKQSLSSLKESSEQEDLEISTKSSEDDKLVEAFLESRAQEEVSFSAPQARKQQRTRKQNSPVKPVISDNEVVKVAETLNDQSFVDVVTVSNPNVGVKQITINTETPKLIAVGLMKTYMNRTDSILNPIRFILNNFSQVSLAFLQLLLPALVVMLIVDSSATIQEQLAKETQVVYWLYLTLFYFACIFLFISGQVIAGGLINIFKTALGNLEKAGKTN